MILCCHKQGKAISAQRQSRLRQESHLIAQGRNSWCQSGLVLQWSYLSWHRTGQTRTCRPNVWACRCHAQDRVVLWPHNQSVSWSCMVSLNACAVFGGYRSLHWPPVRRCGHRSTEVVLRYRRRQCWGVRAQGLCCCMSSCRSSQDHWRRVNRLLTYCQQLTHRCRTFWTHLRAVGLNAVTEGWLWHAKIPHMLAAHSFKSQVLSLLK